MPTNNTQINRIATKRIADALGKLNEEVVFVGGAVVSLYIDDPAAEDVRPTKDIDISLQISSLTQLEALRQELTNKGFIQSIEDDIICRFRYDDIKVDVLSTQAVGWAPANPWFAPGFPKAISTDLEGTQIRILPLPYFLATKFEAFKDRGGIDPRTSHDFEDIVYLLNYTSTFTNKVLAAGKKVKEYLKLEFQEILESNSLQEAIFAHLYHEKRMERFNRIIDILTDTCRQL